MLGFASAMNSLLIFSYAQPGGYYLLSRSKLVPLQIFVSVCLICADSQTLRSVGKVLISFFGSAGCGDIVNSMSDILQLDSTVKVHDCTATKISFPSASVSKAK